MPTKEVYNQNFGQGDIAYVLGYSSHVLSVTQLNFKILIDKNEIST